MPGVPQSKESIERRELECTCDNQETEHYSEQRRFRDLNRYRVLRRTRTGLASNRVWLYTVDELEETETDRRVLQVVRWRARFDNKNHPVWQNRSRYNIRSQEEWDSSSTAVEALMSGTELRHVDDFQEGYSSVETSPPSPPTAKPDPAQTSTDEQRVAALQEELRQVKAAKDVEAARRRQANSWLRRMKKHTKTYRRVLDEFRKLVTNPETNETEVHKFIRKHSPFWLFGLEYLAVEGPVGFPPRPRKSAFFFDLMLERADGYYDLVELKGPNDRLFDARTPKRGKPNAKLSEALGQVIAYLNACDKFGRGHLFKPKAVIVIGNRKTDDPRQRRLLARHLAHVEVLTYSGLVERGNQLLKILEGWKD